MKVKIPTEWGGLNSYQFLKKEMLLSVKIINISFIYYAAKSYEHVLERRTRKRIES